MLRIQKFLRQIWDLYFVLRLLVLEFIANQLSLFPCWEDVIIIKTNHHFVNPFGVRLKFINLFVQIERITAVSNGSRLILLVGAIHEDLFAVQEHDFGDVTVGKNSTWGWYSIFNEVVFDSFSLFVFLRFRCDFYFIDAFVFVTDRCVERSTDVNGSLINESQFLIFAYKNTGDGLDVKSRGCKNLKFDWRVLQLIVVDEAIICA